MADYKTPQWLLPNEKNLAYPAAGDGITGSGLSEDRHSLYSMDFNSGDYISANNTFLNSSTEFSISFWAKLSNASLNIVLGDIITPYSHGFSFNWAGGYEYVSGTVGTIIVRCQNGSSSPIILFPFAGDTNWHHFAVTYKTGTRKLYVNGSLSATNASGPSSMPATLGNTFKIGIDNSGGSNVTNGKIDEVAIFNTELTANEVQALSTASAPANIMALNKKPIAYYPLGEQAQMGSANWSFPNGSLQSHAVDFNSASSESIILSTSASFQVQAQTVSMWVKPELNTRDPLFLNGHTAVGNVGFEVYQDFGNIRVRINGSSQAIGAVNIGEWNHIFAAYDGADLKYSVNGATIATYNFAATISYSSYTGLILGNSAYGYYDGQTSNVAFWTSDQSSNYVNAYNNGSPQSTYTATPTAWWKLNAANSSYVYPWSLELNGDPDVSGGGDHAKVVSNALEIRDIDSSGASSGTGGKVDFLTKEITGAYSGIDVTGEFVINTASSYTNGATLYYKIDGGSWVQFQQQLDTSGTTTYAISGASGLTSTTSFQVKIEFETGNSGSSTVTLNNISIGGLYTEDFTNQNGAGWDNDTYTPPPVDWTFIDTETPAPNYTSALSFDGSNDYIDLGGDSSLFPTTAVTVSIWLKASTQGNFKYILAAPNTASYPAYGFQVKTSGASQYVQFVLNTGTAIISPFADVLDNNWHHIAATYNGSILKMFVDGSEVGTGTSTSGSIIYGPGAGTGAGKLLMGDFGVSSLFFTGSLSNCSIYSSALSAAQVQTLYNSGTPETAISSSPISWWKLDNTTTGIQDSGSASNNGTNNGATQIATNVLISDNGESDTLPTSALIPSDLQFESPYSNYSLDFDGIGNYLNTQSTPLQLGLPATTVTASDFSLSFWYYFDATQNYDPIMQASVSATNGFGVWQSTTNTSSLNFWVGNYSSGSLYTTQLTSGTWYHIGCVFKGGATHTQEIYVNGVLNNTVSYTTSRVIQSGENCLIGGQTFNSRYLSGKLDEIAVWSSALSQDQIIQVYNNGYPANIASLSPTAWWRLGEDAYFVGNDITIPNQITGGQTGTGAGTQTAILVGNAPGSYANGSGTNLAVEDRIGDAPESTANSVSINMIPSNRHSYPAGYVPTQVDNAFSMEFDGINDYYATNFTNFPANLTDNFSVSFWVKMAPVTSNIYKRVHPASVSQNVSDIDQTVHLRAWAGITGRGIQYRVRLVSSVTNVEHEGTTDISDNNWHNITYTYDYDSSTTYYTVKIYVDGNSTPEVTSLMYTGAYKTRGLHTIGVLSDWAAPYALNAGTYFPGFIDEVALFNYALSERQIKQDIYEGTTAGGKTADLNNISNLTAPVAWYRMGD